MVECQKFDDAFMSVLQDCNGLPSFLDAIFGFLNRRTDFYYVAEDSHSPVGLPEGWAEEFVRRAFFKWKPKEKQPPKIVEVPEAAKEIEVTTSSVEEISIQDKNVQNSESEQTRTKEPNFDSSECYNGAQYDKYSWSQSITEVDIIIKVPENTTSKDLSVNITQKKISVKVKKTNEVLLEGDLCNKCKHQDVMWSLVKNKLEIHLEKLSEFWWDCLVLSEPRLDISKLDCSRPYEELSEEAQAKIEELTWNQERKRLGLPTSEELAVQEKLRKGWNAEGSPFSGPFDPSILK